MPSIEPKETVIEEEIEETKVSFPWKALAIISSIIAASFMISIGLILVIAMLP